MPAWEDLYPNPTLQPLSSSIFDHCPLMFMPHTSPPFKLIFRFEAFWTKMPGYLDCVQGAWNRETPSNPNPLGRPHIKLSRTAKALRAWAKSLLPHRTIALAIYCEVIDQMERVQKSRAWTTEERNMIRHLKTRILGLASIERSRARQRPRLTWFKLGDANIKFFHLAANGRKKKNCIRSLQTNDGVALT
jgi:hypothetical protein